MRNALAILLDLVLVLVFAIIGRASHAEGLTLAGIAETVWPFAFALLVGWAVLLLRKRDPLSLGSAIYLWIVTTFGGMLVRVLSGGTTAVAFIIVTAITLAIFLIGWRLIAAQVERRRGAAPARD